MLVVMRETALQKMMRSRAAADRIINQLPEPFRSDATPYIEPDFHPSVRAACKNDRTIKIGLKISKVVFVGDVAVGKTCLVNRFCHEIFDTNYKATIGVDFEVERFDILDTPFNLQIWDTAGQERFKSIASSYYRGADVVVIVFDMTNLMSLHHAPNWLEETLQNINRVPLIFLVGTKRDLVTESALKVIESEALRIAKLIKAEYWSASSRTNENVTSFFLRMASLTFNQSVLRELETNELDRKHITNDFVRISREADLYESKKKSICSSGCQK